MLLSNEIEVKIEKRNIRIYKEQGIDCRLGDAVTVAVDMLPVGSHLKVKVLCDYCNKEYSKEYKNYIKDRNNVYCSLDVCNNCKTKKMNDVHMKKYGVKIPAQRQEVAKKISESHKHQFDFVKNQFEIRNYILISETYIDSQVPLLYICQKHYEKGTQDITFNSLYNGGCGCRNCGFERTIASITKGGISPLRDYMRDKIKQWKVDSLKSNNYRCAVTNKKGDLVVHHIISFNTLLEETLVESKAPLYQKINEYSDELLYRIEKLLIEKHYFYGLGAPLLPQIHNLFHKVYGKGNNTREQFSEFVVRYKSGEFREDTNNTSLFVLER